MAVFSAGTDAGAAAPDGKMADGTIPECATPDGAFTDGAIPDAAAPDGVVASAALPRKDGKSLGLVGGTVGIEESGLVGLVSLGDCMAACLMSYQIWMSSGEGLPGCGVLPSRVSCDNPAWKKGCLGCLACNSIVFTALT